MGFSGIRLTYDVALKELLNEEESGDIGEERAREVKEAGRRIKGELDCRIQV